MWCNNEKLCKKIQQNYTNISITACFMKLEDRTCCMFFCISANEKIYVKMWVMHFVYER